jgi:hypothetical protein
LPQTRQRTLESGLRQSRDERGLRVG